MNILRRLPLSRLLLLCALVVAIGVSATALASALGSGPTPPAKPLAQAVHDALAGPSVEGVSASVKLTDHLLEGANLANGNGEAGPLSSSPLISGSSGRLWIAKNGRVRLELQAEKGDTQILYDGHTVTVYDGSSNTVYRYVVPAHEGGAGDVTKPDAGAADEHKPPTVAKVEEAIAKLRAHVNVSGATPTDVAGQSAYTVRVSPNEGGSLIGGAELSFDAVHGIPLRAAVYSSTSSSPVIELAADEISYGPVDASVFDFTPPPGAKVEEVTTPVGHSAGAAASKDLAPSADQRPADHGRGTVTTHGSGITAVKVLESPVKPGQSRSKLSLPEGLPKVKVNGISAAQLATPLGTLLSFERSGVRYLLVGAVTPAAIQAVAQGL